MIRLTGCGQACWVRETRRRRVILAFLSSLVLVPLSTGPAVSAELRLTVDGIRSDDGEILVALYDGADGFQSAIVNAAVRGLMPDSGRLIGTAIRAKRGRLSTVFTQLPPGRYAVVVVHDENDNGRIDRDILGAPTEGYGFGNDAQGFFSAPTFDAAAITVGSADLSTFITLIYPAPPWAGDGHRRGKGRHP